MGQRFDNSYEVVQLVKDQFKTREVETQKEKNQEMKLCCIRTVNSKLGLLLLLDAQYTQYFLPFKTVSLITLVTANSMIKLSDVDGRATEVDQHL